MSNKLSNQLAKGVKQNKGKGLVALAGIGLGVLAYFGYKRLPQEKKDQIADALTEVGDKVKETYSDIEESISKKRAELQKLTDEKKESITV